MKPIPAAVKLLAILAIVSATLAAPAPPYGLAGPPAGSQAAQAGEAAVASGSYPRAMVVPEQGEAAINLTPGQSLTLDVAPSLPAQAGVHSLVLTVVPGAGNGTAMVSVKRIPSTMPPASPPPGAVESYVEITPSVPASGQISLTIDCAWLETLNVSAPTSRVAVYHLDAASGAWTRLPSVFVPDPSGCGSVAFTTPSFSWFSLGVDSGSGSPAASSTGGGAVPSPGFEAALAAAGLFVAALLRRGRNARR